jgi:hypothetical protein
MHFFRETRLNTMRGPAFAASPKSAYSWQYRAGTPARSILMYTAVLRAVLPIRRTACTHQKKLLFLEMP